MDCTLFTERIDALLDGTLPAAEQARAEAHRDGCPQCSELYRLLSSAEELAASAPPHDLTGSILARTSGPPCDQARAKLGARVDGALDALDRELVDAHVNGCADCAALLRALTWLQDDLPAFAELPPDPALLHAVLAQTVPETLRPPVVNAPWRTSGAGHGAARPGNDRGLWARLRAAGRQLLERPRIAWETGYVAAVVVWLLFGAAWSPLRTAPVQALALVQQGAIETHAAGSAAVETINRRLTAMRTRALRFGGDQLYDRLSMRYRRAAAAAPDLRRHWRQFTTAVLDRDLFSGVDALRSLSSDATALLRGVLRGPAPDPATTTDSGPFPEQRSKS